MIIKNPVPLAAALTAVTLTIVGVAVGILPHRSEPEGTARTQPPKAQAELHPLEMLALMALIIASADDEDA